MPRRPLFAGGVAALVIGAFLLALGFGWGRGEARAAGTNLPTSSASSTAPSSMASTPVESPTAGSTPTRTPVPTTPASITQTPQHHPARPRTTTPPLTSDLSLSVGAIGLDTPLISGGVNSSGTISPPAGQAMWVRGYGRVKPGKVGTAVVAGHVVASGTDDIFADLSSVRVGNTVIIRSGSVTRTYVVKRAAVVKKAALTHDPDVWGQNTTNRRIVLVTCDDELGYRSDGHRVANYVVVADAV